MTRPLAKLSSKSQAVVPKQVREKLKVGPGDVLAFEIDGDRVIVSKHEPGPADDPFHAFTEWASAADEEAYADL